MELLGFENVQATADVVSTIEINIKKKKGEEIKFWFCHDIQYLEFRALLCKLGRGRGCLGLLCDHNLPGTASYAVPHFNLITRWNPTLLERNALEVFECRDELMMSYNDQRFPIHILNENLNSKMVYKVEIPYRKSQPKSGT